MAAPTKPIKVTEVKNAVRELNRMKRSLRGWLKYRLLNDHVLAGKAPTKVGLERARQVILQARDPKVEFALAERLHVLLSEVMPDVALPAPSSPNAAVHLATIALEGSQQAASPQPQGLIPHVPWPVLIVAGVLVLAVTAIHTYADVAKERERYACIQAGACTDYGFWIKAAGVAVVGWFVWEKTAVGASIKRRLGVGNTKR